MTLQEVLKTLDLTEDQQKAIIKAMKDNKIYTASEENLDVRYAKLKQDHDNLTTEHEKSTGLIAELQKATQGQEQIQNKISEYENTIADLKAEADNAKVEAELKISLLSSGAKSDDIDYLIFKMEHDDPDWKPELTDQGKIKGIDDKIKGLKTQFPNQFEGAGTKKIEEKKLVKPEEKTTVTKDEFKNMGYQDRLNLKKSNPDLYKSLTK